MNESTLRALSIGELLDKAFSIYRRRFSLLLSIVAAVLIPNALLQLLGVFFLGQFQSFAAFPQGFLLLLAQVAIVAVVSDEYLNKNISFQSAYAEGSKRYWSVWGANLLRGLALGVPFGILFACSMLISQVLGIAMIVIASPFLIYFSTRWSLSMPAIILENIGATDGLKRSWDMTKAHFWRVLGTSFAASLLTMLLTYLPTLFVQYIFENIVPVSLEVQQAVNVLITQAALLISLPFSVAVIVLIYYNLRIRTEGFDLMVLADEIAVDKKTEPAA